VVNVHTEVKSLRFYSLIFVSSEANGLVDRWIGLLHASLNRSAQLAVVHLLVVL
jgi:hypothetical protein